MIYKEKRDLFSSLNDLSHALGHLNWALYGFSAFVTLLISLPIYGISLNAILPFTSFFLALSFVFGGYVVDENAISNPNNTGRPKRPSIVLCSYL